MSEHEFERYLALLSGMLRLSQSQRTSLAAELRDHFEARLGELLSRGESKEAAIQQALEEFGDAAGLAAEFSRVVQMQRRRWIVRLTLGSTAAIAALLLLGFAFWPQSHNLVAPPRGLAEDQTEASLFGLGQSPAEEGAPVAEQQPKEVRQTERLSGSHPSLETEQRLTKRIPAEFVETPLGDVLDYLSDSQKLQFHINRREVEDIGIEPNDVMVTVDFEQVRIDVLLDLILEENGLAYTIRDGIVIVTTPEAIESAMEVRVYNCRDLLAMSPAATGEGMYGGGAMGMGEGMGEGMGGMAGMMSGMGAGGMGMGGMGMAGSEGGGEPHPMDQLIDLLTTTANPESWDMVGGPGSIASFKGLLVISQDSQTHREIATLLQMLRDADRKPPGTSIRSR